jgi:hypothetical protein
MIKSKCWPNPTQELLLKACLLEEKVAFDAWEQWRTKIDFEDLDWASFRLLPKLYRNLSNLQIKDTILQKSKGIYRKTWYENQMRFQSLANICEQFREEKIPTLVFKGAALSLEDYQDCGVRPMADLDILIPLNCVEKAETLVKKLSWKSIEEINSLARLTRSKHAVNYRNLSGEEIDLHWHLLANCLQDDSDLNFWKFAVPLTNERLSTLTLSPTDRLLSVCVHGLSWSSSYPCRWVADAVTIIQRWGNSIDWQRLLVYAQKHRLTIAITEAFRYLQEVFHAAIPVSIVALLTDTIPINIEWRLFNAGMRPFTLASPQEMIIADRAIDSVTETDLREAGYPLEYKFSQPALAEKKIRLGILTANCNSNLETRVIAQIYQHLDRDRSTIFLYTRDGSFQPTPLELEWQNRIERLTILPVAPIFYLCDESKLLTSVETIRADRLDFLLILNDLAEDSFARLLVCHQLARRHLVLESIDDLSYFAANNSHSQELIKIAWQHLSISLDDWLLQGQIEVLPKNVLNPINRDSKEKLAIYLNRIRQNLSQLRERPERWH